MGRLFTVIIRVDIDSDDDLIITAGPIHTTVSQDIAHKYAQIAAQALSDVMERDEGYEK